MCTKFAIPNVAVLLIASMSYAAPIPKSDPPAKVSAPVQYKDLMLILVAKDGVAAVVFENPAADGSGVEYNFRFESADGKTKKSGSGKLFERRRGGPNGDFDPEGLFIKAGPISMEWSRGGQDRGWIYYAPENCSVLIANASGFARQAELQLDRTQHVRPELDLRRFVKK